MASLLNSNPVKVLFFGNYYYGICAVALSVEATLQQRQPLSGPGFYLLLFCATVLYYSLAYIKTETSPDSGNLRSRWYANNRSFILGSQALLTLLALVCLMLFLAKALPFLLSLYAYEYLILVFFPAVALMYYGVNLKQAYSLRNVGWLKPFIIGFIWAGMVNVYPVIYNSILQGGHYQLTSVGALLFVKNFMYVTVLCIMFDIKDYAMDYNQRLKTFVVKAGLRKTIFYIIIPLTLLGLASFLCFAVLRHFSAGKILLNTIPFLLIILVAQSLQTRKSIFYYLAIIDGLMLVKAACGTLAMLYF